MPFTSTTELKSFVEPCKVFRQLLPNFARVAATLNKRLLKEQQHSFALLGRDELAAHNKLKDSLISPLVPAFLSSRASITFETDASSDPTKFVLHHKQLNNFVEPILY